MNPTAEPQEIWASDELLDLTRRGVVVWRAVEGTEGRYEASNFGEARSWAGPGRRPRAEPLVLSACPNTDGYPSVTIFYPDGHSRHVLVHNLMCETFIGPRPGPATHWQGGHKNDVKTENTLTNVRWVSNSLNVTERWGNGKAGRSARPSRVIDGVTHWQCTKCAEWKPEAEFAQISRTLAPRSRCGIQSRCVECSRAAGRAYKRKARAKAA